jgi:hypothetical protein
MSTSAQPYLMLIGTVPWGTSPLNELDPEHGVEPSRGRPVLRAGVSRPGMQAVTVLLALPRPAKQAIALVVDALLAVLTAPGWP